MKAPTCPKCKSELVGRTHRAGLVEQALSLGYVYPFKCQVCQHRFLRLRWGERYVRVPLDRRDAERLPTRIPVTIHWKDGGPTDLHHLILFCDRHHHVVHQPSWNMTFDGTTLTITRPDGTILE